MRRFNFIIICIVIFSCNEKKKQNVSVKMQDGQSFIYNNETGATMLDICMFNGGREMYKINFRNKFSKSGEKYTSKFALQNRINNKFIDLESMELRPGQQIEPGHYYCFRYGTIDEDIPSIYRNHKGVFDFNAFKKYYNIYFINHKDTVLVK